MQDSRRQVKINLLPKHASHDEVYRVLSFHDLRQRELFVTRL